MISNPTESKITLNIPPDLLGSEATLYSTLGQKLTSFSVNDQDVSFDMATYTPGIYFLKLESKLGILTREIIKK